MNDRNIILDIAVTSGPMFNCWDKVRELVNQGITIYRMTGSRSTINGETFGERMGRRQDSRSMWAPSDINYFRIKVPNTDAGKNLIMLFLIKVNGIKIIDMTHKKEFSCLEGS